jgi:hypothetical protein
MGQDQTVLREVITWQEMHGHPMTFGIEASIDLAEDQAGGSKVARPYRCAPPRDMVMIIRRE